MLLSRNGKAPVRSSWLFTCGLLALVEPTPVVGNDLAGVSPLIRRFYSS
jgi:hypothetical protein